MQMRKKSEVLKRTQALFPGKRPNAVATQSSLYREVVAEREEIMRHKWLLSERAGYDVGYLHAMYDWIAHHRGEWRKAWRKKNPEPHDQKA